MKNITKDEIYNWMPCSDSITSDAQIPDDMHKCLTDAISVYQGVCKMIHDYLEEHPEDNKYHETGE